MEKPNKFKKRKGKFKEKKRDGPNRKARLVLRNLSFKATDDNVREHFSKYGQIDEVKLLRRPDGKLVGCGFIQFHAVQMAAKAMYNTTGKPFMGRPLICDWAVPKNKYVQQIQTNESNDQKDEIVTIKEEVLSDDETKEVLTNTEHDDSNEIKTERESDGDDDTDKSKTSVKDDSDSSDNESNVSDKESESEQPDIDLENVKNDNASYEPELKKARMESHDVAEGRTVFIKNVPFTATNEDLKECMKQFGRIFYALICIDPLTEHSKGTAFVKFVDKDDAQKCLEAGTELSLLGNVLDCHEALDRKTIQDKKNKVVKVKDSRNLYLVKEGVVMAGSKAAEGVSAADMAKRLHMEQLKSQMLRNLNMFVSRVRLVIHNLPASWDDAKLRSLIIKHVGTKAIIREARVMRDLKNLDSKGVGKSKEYGFVTFASHEDALAALRSLNNNPNIFNPSRRPIVAFSIENKTVINARQKRLLKSKMHNPHCKEYDANFAKRKKEPEQKEAVNNKKQKTSNKLRNDEQENQYAGIEGKPGNKRMGKKFNVKTQAKVHFQNLKKEKKKAKKIRQLQQSKADHIRQPRQKIGKRKKENDQFSKLENKFKNTTPAKLVTKKKWYN